MGLDTNLKQTIVNKIRLKLALWFVCTVMLLYSAGGVASLFVFKAMLTRSVDMSLEDLIAEIRPSVKISAENPSLQYWSDTAQEQASSLLATVQLWDEHKKLIEEYGPEGVHRLEMGTLKIVRGSKREVVRSMNRPIERDHVTYGYLQLQVTTKPQDDAIKQFAMTVLAIAPFIAGGVGVCAYLFSGQAVKPIERTMLLLRRFVADAGHELNTPVATIEACLETIKDPDKLGNMTPEVLNMMERASERLRYLAKDLVTLARIEDPEADLLRVNVDLREMAETVVTELLPAASERQIEIQLDPFPEIKITAHAESILEIFTNLIENAIKYSEANGRVRVSLEQKDHSVWITVADKGIGIPADSIDLVFDRFYRVDRSRSRDVGGSGLGLSIVKAAVERHGGHVHIESEVGRGTTFRVMLPLHHRQSKLTG